MTADKTKLGWGHLCFLYVIGIISLTMSGRVKFADATAGATVICAVIAAGVLIGQKFGERYGSIFCWIGVPIASLIAYMIFIQG